MHSSLVLLSLLVGLEPTPPVRVPIRVVSADRPVTSASMPADHTDHTPGMTGMNGMDDMNGMSGMHGMGIGDLAMGTMGFMDVMGSRAEPGLLMNLLHGKGLCGDRAEMGCSRFSVSGWTNVSYTSSSADCLN